MRFLKLEMAGKALGKSEFTYKYKMKRYRQTGEKGTRFLKWTENEPPKKT